MSYIGNSPGVASQRVTTTLTATAAQTQFTTQSGYVLGYVDVYLNGAKLVNGSDFEAITGTSITLFAGAVSGDVVELVSYVPRGLTDGYTKAEADSKFLDVGGDTATGNLAFATATLSGNLTLNGGTANGVGYLNGSKVVVAGSALTFDGTVLAAPTLNLTNALGVASGGTGQTTANAALNALLPTQTGNATKYLQTDGTNTTWDAVSLSTADITGTLPIANGGTGATTAAGALTSLGAYAASNPSGYTTNTGTVTSVGGTGTVNGLTLTGTVSTTGNLTLGGTLSLASSPAIGSTTPNTGAFTTLSASGAVTLSGGTANGVAFLNSSKVLTTGSALTFDGTTLANSIGGGIGFRLTASSTSSIRQQFVSNGGTFSVGLDSSTGSIFSAAYAGIIWHDGNYPLVFGVNNAEALRLTSNSLYTASGINVGFGASNPLTRLSITSVANAPIPTLGTPSGGFSLLGSAGQYGIYAGVSDSGNSWIQAMRNTGSAIAYELLLQPSGGNVGIGTSSPVAKNHIRGSGTSGQVTASWILENFSSGTAGMDITGSAGASRLRFLYGGGPSTGTNTLTESMCILTEGANAGNVGIGTPTPTNKLDVNGSSVFRGNTSVASGNILYLSNSVNTASGTLYCPGGGSLSLASYGNEMIRLNEDTSIIFKVGSATERARIDNTGTLIIGPAATGNTNTSKLVVAGTISQTVGGNQYQVVDQSDIGTAPNEIPLNQYLGSMAYQNGNAYYNTGMTVGFRNRIINGDMRIAQRATTVSGYTGGGYQTLDRWNLFQNLGAMNIAQSSTAPDGFSNSMQFTVSTAASQTSSSSSIVTPNQSIEGFNFDDMAWGTSNAKSVNVSVWVYSNLVGQYAIWMRNSAADRYYSTPFTISTASTWQQISVTIPGDTSGTWLRATNGIGATVGICLTAGSSRVGTANTWSGSTTFGVTGQVDWQATTSNVFYFTGFQLEKSNIATSFDVRPFGTELALCQRYFQKLADVANHSSSGIYFGTAADTSSVIGYATFQVPMRTAPTLAVTATIFRANFGATNGDSTTAPTLGSTSNVNTRFDQGGFANSLTTNVSGIVRLNGGTGYVAVSAEL